MNISKRMKQIRSPYTEIVLLAVGFLLTFGVYFLSSKKYTGYLKDDEAIFNKLPDTLDIVTLSGSTTYFTYKDAPMGYQYELVSLFADSLDIPIKIHVAPNTETMLDMLKRKEADLCITPQAVTRSGRQRWRYTGPEQLSGLVLVQRKVKNPADRLDKITRLADKRITIVNDHRYEERLQHISEQIGSHIDVNVLQGDTVTDESLMGEVALGNIDYTVADRMLAKLVRTYYSNLDVSLEIGFRQKLQWIVCLEDSVLAKTLDSLAADIPQNNNYQSIYKRYFELSKGAYLAPVKMIRSGVISDFDHIFQQEAKRLVHWPWQLLASIAYFESNFTPEIIGWSGARGLMGIMPATGRIYGADKAALLDPEVSVRVSVSCLLEIRKYLISVADEEQKLKLALAGYNAGVGHLADARRLAEKFGYDPGVWDGNVEECIKLKREPKYYNDPVCKSGYLRGTETLNYVNNVFGRMKVYQQKTSK